MPEPLETLAESFRTQPVEPQEEKTVEEPVSEEVVEEPVVEEKIPEDIQKEIGAIYRVKYRKGEQDVEEEIDDKKLTEVFGKAAYVEKEMEEVAKTRKDLEKATEAVKKQYEAIQNVKTDPVKAFKELGLDFDSVAKKTVLEQFEYEQMTDEQKAAYDAKKKLQEYQDKEKSWKEGEQKRVTEEENKKAIAMYQAWADKLAKESNLPYNEYLLDRFYAEFNRDRIKQAFRKDDELISAVKEGFSKEMDEHIKKAPDETLLDLLGKDTVSRVVKLYTKSKERPDPVEADAPAKKRKKKEFFNDIDSAFDNG